MKNRKELNVLVGANIKREREKAGYTQERFSEMIGIGAKSLSAIERGTVGVSLETLTKTCRVLSVSSNVLLSESSHKNDVRSLTERLERLSPEQFSIANDIICRLLQAFGLNSTDDHN